MKELFLSYLHKKWCYHDWEERYRNIIYDSTLIEENRLPNSVRVTLICKKCGKIKQIKV